MDILGKKAEENAEQVQQITDKINQLDSHLNAVDSALQDFVDNYNHMLQDELGYQEEELLRLKEVISQQVESEEVEDELLERINSIEGRVSRLENKVDQETEDVVKTVKTIGNSLKMTRRKVSEIEDNLEDLENEFFVYKNNKQYDFEKKLNKRDYEDEKESMQKEIKKLKASINALAEEMDEEDKVEIE